MSSAGLAYVGDGKSKGKRRTACRTVSAGNEFTYLALNGTRGKKESNTYKTECSVELLRSVRSLCFTRLWTSTPHHRRAISLDQSQSTGPAPLISDSHLNRILAMCILQRRPFDCGRCPAQEWVQPCELVQAGQACQYYNRLLAGQTERGGMRLMERRSQKQCGVHAIRNPHEQCEPSRQPK